MARRNSLLAFFIMLSLISFLQSSNNSLNIAYFLKQFYGFSSLPNYQENTFYAGVSTYHKAGGNDDDFNEHILL
jgi:hypothetical protein